MLKNGLLFLIILLFQLTVFAATDVDEPVTTDTKPITVRKTDAHFIIRLKSNPTTGYRWFIRSYPADFVTPTKHSMSKANSALMGAGEQEIFEFDIKRIAFHAPHQFVMRFSYLRPFETSGKTEERTFKVLTVD